MVSLLSGAQSSSSVGGWFSSSLTRRTGSLGNPEDKAVGSTISFDESWASAFCVNHYSSCGLAAPDHCLHLPLAARLYGILCLSVLHCLAQKLLDGDGGDSSAFFWVGLAKSRAQEEAGEGHVRSSLESLCSTDEAHLFEAVADNVDPVALAQ